MYRSMSDFRDAAVMQGKSGDIDGALWSVVNVVDSIISFHTSVARVLSSTELDDACQRLGTMVSSPAVAQVGNHEREDHIVYLVTGLAPSGGHSRVLLDLIHTEGAARKTVLVSNIHPGTHAREFGAFADGQFELELAPNGARISEKVQWVQMRLAQLRPRKTYMALHPFDAVHVAAAQPGLAGKLLYLHNNDHNLALGVKLPHATHLDLHGLGYWSCRENEGVAHSNLIPLVADDLGHRLKRPFFVRGHLTTCSSGGREKFEFGRLNEPLRYRYEYAEGVAEILGATNGTHLHIGPLSSSSIDRIGVNLRRIGIDQGRFVHIPFVASVWKALLDFAVDIYVGSFPYGGGRTTVEAMGAGLPLLVHSNYRSNLLSVESMIYEGAMIWRDFAELAAHLRALNYGILQDHGRRARDHFERHHTIEKLREALHRVDNDIEPDVPKPTYRPNRLQMFLDEHPDVIG